MSKYLHFPGSPPIRVATASDIPVAPPPVPVTVPRALTASSMKLSGRASRDSAYMTRLSLPEQLRSLSYYDLIGEIRFASQFYAKLLSKVRFYPARQLEDGNTEPISSGPPVEILHRIQDPGGGRSRLQYDYGRMMFVTGEGVLFINEVRGVEQARFLWKDEVKKTDDGERWQRVRSDKTPFAPPQVGEAYRFWTPHPRHSDEADWPVRSVMSIAEELLALEGTVMSTAVSRRTNGMMIIPSELSPNDYGPSGDEDPQNNIFLNDYMEHISQQKENPGTAEAATPFLLEGAYDYIDAEHLRWMATHDPQTDYMEKELRKEAVWRLAIGMDFPPEFLLGMTDANHWTARQVVYDMWRSYGSPIAERFGDDLADSYLRPLLEDENYPDFQDVVIAFDDSKVVIPPDMTEIAKDLVDRVAISRKGYRELSGVSHDLAPDEEEEALLISMKLRQPIEIADGELVIPQRGPVAQSNGNAPEDGPPAPSGGRDGSRQESRTASVLIHGAAQMALMRCRELAGVRIRHKCEDCAEGSPPSLVASAMGPEYVKEPLKLVQGGTDGFHFWLSEQAFEDSQAFSLCQQLEVYAARTLFQPRCPELPSGFVAAVEKAREVSNALAPGT